MDFAKRILFAMLPVNILVEGLSDETVAKRLLKHVGLEVGTVYGKKGKPHLRERLPNYNQAAHFSPWFVIVDLDTDKLCPSEALQIWLPQPAKGMRCRVAVRAIEAWLLADSKNLAQFLSISEAKIDTNPDNYLNPKEELISLARTSRSSAIRDSMVPRPGSGAKIGPLYVPKLIDFTEKYWNPEIAATKSKSLNSCINALSTLMDRE
jgi:hypothetical protein